MVDQSENSSPVDWEAPPRRWVLGLALALGGLGLLFVLVASRVRPPQPAVVVDVRSEAVTLVPDTALDLVALAPRDADESAGIRLHPPWIIVSSDSITTPAGQYRDSVIGEPLPALVLQHLEVTEDCAIRINQSGNGWLQLRIVNEDRGGSAEEDGCRMLGQIWSGSSLPEASDSVAVPEWDEAIPVPSVFLVHARPTRDRPASLAFRPADELRLRRIAVSRLSFEDWERAPPVESAIIEGTIRFPEADNSENQLHVRDTLLLGRLEGNLVELAARRQRVRMRLGSNSEGIRLEPAAENSIHALFKGSASDPRMSPNLSDLRPTWLRKHWNRIQVIVAIVAGVIAFLAGLVESGLIPPIREWFSKPLREWK